MTNLRAFAHLTTTLAALGSVASQEMTAKQILNEMSPVATTGASAIGTEEIIWDCAGGVALTCHLEAEKQIKHLNGLTFETDGNLQSYQAGAALLNTCWRGCLPDEDLKGLCLALDHAKSVVKERIFLPTPTPCQPYTMPVKKAARAAAATAVESNTTDGWVCAGGKSLTCRLGAEAGIENLNSLTFDTNGNLQSYRRGEALLDDCWMCLSEDNLEALCLALDHAKSAVREKILLPTPAQCKPYVNNSNDDPMVCAGSVALSCREKAISISYSLRKNLVGIPETWLQTYKAKYFEGVEVIEDCSKGCMSAKVKAELCGALRFANDLLGPLELGPRVYPLECMRI